MLLDEIGFPPEVVYKIYSYIGCSLTKKVLEELLNRTKIKKTKKTKLLFLKPKINIIRTSKGIIPSTYYINLNTGNKLETILDDYQIIYFKKYGINYDFIYSKRYLQTKLNTSLVFIVKNKFRT